MARPRLTNPGYGMEQEAPQSPLSPYAPADGSQPNPYLDDALRRQMGAPVVSPGGSPTFNEKGPAVDAAAGASRGQAAATPSFDGKNWSGVTRSGGGGAFASYLSGFDANKLNDPTGAQFGDSNTSKYWFGSIAQNFDPRDDNSLSKIVEEARKLGFNWSFDGKDKVDFGDGYGFIDVRTKAGGDPGDEEWAWQPQGGGTGASSMGGGAAGGVIGGAFPQVSSGQSQMDAIQAEIDRLLQKKQPTDQLLQQMRTA